MKRTVIACAVLLLVTACNHHQKPPAVVTPPTSSVLIFPPGHTQTETPSTTSGYGTEPVQTPTPFENPPDSTGIGKG